jgi:hypothetical protein
MAGFSDAETDLERFALVAEQLVVCRELLVSGSVPKARMAIILLDQLADALIFRRCQLAYSIWEARAWMRQHHPRYGRAEKRRAARDFGRRIEIAQALDRHSPGNPEDPVIRDGGDAAILRIAHRYRNLAHHRDRHNPLVVPAIARVLFRAVTDIWVRGYRRGSAVGHSGIKARLAEVGIEALGSSGDAADFGHHGEWLNFRDDAERVRAALLPEVETDDEKVRVVLAVDLNDRVGELLSGIDYLPDGRKRLNGLVEWFQFWDTHGADDELIESEAARDVVGRLVAEGESRRAEIEAEAVQANERYLARLEKLRRDWNPKPATEVIANANAATERLMDNQTLEESLLRYEPVDRDLDAVERVIRDAIYQFDEWVNMQVHDMRIERIDD